MPAIIITVLSVIGWCLLYLLLAVLLLLFLLLSVPFRYRFRAEASSNTYNVSGKVDWLWGGFSATYSYPKPNALLFRVLGIKVYRADFQKEEEESQASPLKEAPETETPDTANPSCSSEAEEANQGNTSPVSSTKQHTAQKPENSSYKHKNTTSQKAQTKKKTGCKEKILFYRTLLAEEETKLCLRHVLCRIAKILKNIRPRKCKGTILFGTGSPDTTGYLCAFYGMFYPYYGNTLKVTGDFENRILEGEICISGHLTLSVLAFHLIRILLDPKLQRILHRLKREAH